MIEIRPAKTADGPSLWRLAADLETLETNSAYAYLLLCRDFGDSCRVALEGERVVGFVVGYRPPRRPETLFVWQIGVHPDARGRGLAGRLLRHVVGGPGSAGVTCLEATVTPGNEASRALFRSFGRAVDAPCEVTPHFVREHFPEPHEPEDLFRIGPFDRRRAGTRTAAGVEAVS